MEAQLPPLPIFSFILEKIFRLVNGAMPYEGIVAVKHDGKWGRVCSDDFTDNEAMVVCRSLGFR